MIRRFPILAGSLLALVGAGFLACSQEPTVGVGAGETALTAQNHGKGGFEVWIADQSGTRAQAGPPADYGGWLHIFEGTDLMGHNASQAKPITSIDLGAETAELCFASTAARPTRPHMVAFNEEHTHAILSFVASGHVVIFDARSRMPLSCFRTEASPSTGTRQAHAAFAAPDGSYIIIANQNGKRLERIDTNFRTNTFVHNTAAAVDFAGAGCTTPLGQPCEHPDIRPINWPICPIIDSTSRLVFTTLRGGGLFVVDAKQTPMKIVGEYDHHAVRGNGCGGAEVAGHMYVNSGGSPVGTDDHVHKFGFDVYRLPLSGYPASEPNHPAAAEILSKDGETDSHGMVATKDHRYIWVADRLQNVIEVIDVAQARRVHTFSLEGPLTDDPSPDLLDIAPAGNRVFASLRGPVPLSGDPHNSTGTTPGLAVIQVTQGGRNGQLIGIVRLENPLLQPNQAPDPHGIKVRERR